MQRVIYFICVVLLGNALCTENYNRNVQQNPWQNLKNSSYDYSNQGNNLVTPWPALGGNRNTQNNFQSTRPPQWVRPNNGPNWVRNTQPQNSQLSYQNNLSSQKPISQGFNPHSSQQYYTNTREQNNNLFLNNFNYGRSNSTNRSNQNTGFRQEGSYVRPTGVNNVISSGSLLTRSDDAGARTQGSVAGQSREVDDNELRQFSEDLLGYDNTNNAARYVTVNWQGMTSSRSTKDEAPLPLLSVNRAAFSLDTVSKLLPLYDNYILEANKDEVYTAQEKNEENYLLDAIIQTPVMQFTRDFLVNTGRLGRDIKEFKDLLNLIWFNMYSRQKRKVGSSGFEHVFLAEIKNNQVSGLHNWIYFNEEEKKNHINYLGYMKKIDLGGKGYILKFHFTLNGVDKPVNSMFIGTSPELEMALYSTCFILRPDRVCPLKMNGNRFIIRTYTFTYQGKNLIGSAFPEI